jgi:CRISPR-associated exonuclease Cas4
MYDEDDFLLISGIQHFIFCRRQWALIHVECLWADNERTVSGELLHKRVHDPRIKEKRGDLIVARDMPIFSYTLGITGNCDVVEFHRSETGVTLSGRKGLWRPCPVEYKRGSPKTSDADRMQLCTQALCLEEMLACARIETGYLYYGETNRREPVLLDDEMRGKVRMAFEEMHGYYKRGYTPRVKPKKSCAACSLNDQCLPKLPDAANSARAYIDSHI